MKCEKRRKCENTGGIENKKKKYPYSVYEITLRAALAVVASHFAHILSAWIKQERGGAGEQGDTTSNTSVDNEN